MKLNFWHRKWAVAWRLAYGRAPPTIAAFEPDLRSWGTRLRSGALPFATVHGREPLVRLLPEAYALVREAGRRTRTWHLTSTAPGGTPFNRSIVEMQTGRQT